MITLSREVPVDPAHAGLLIVDVRNHCVSGKSEKTEYFRQSLCGTVLPDIRRLQHACRHAGVEVICSVIENLTRAGRDRSLDYKISGIDVPRGSWDAEVLSSRRQRMKWSSARPRAASSSRPISITCCAI